MSQSTQTSRNFLKDFPTPILALTTFLEGEKKAANMRRKQCDSFIATSKMLLLSVEEEVRNSVYNLRKKANEELSIVLRLLSLIRYIFLILNFNKIINILILMTY